jgi:hypothetical protein
MTKPFIFGPQLHAVVRCPNAATPAEGVEGRGPDCVAVTSKLAPCPNGARWVLHTDCGVDLQVCLTHVRAAERQDTITVDARKAGIVPQLGMWRHW